MSDPIKLDEVADFLPENHFTGSLLVPAWSETWAWMTSRLPLKLPTRFNGVLAAIYIYCPSVNPASLVGGNPTLT